MRRALWMIAVIAGSAIGGSEPARACSENVFRPGQGMAYRKLASASPARILIDASPAADSLSVERAAELRLGLSEAGHTVEVRTEARPAAALLGAGTYDVVITGAARAEVLVRGANADPAAPIVLPVLRAKDDASAVRKRFGQSLPRDPSLRQILKAIERLMEHRGR